MIGRINFGNTPSPDELNAKTRLELQAARDKADADKRAHTLAVLRELREKATEHYTPALRVMAVPVAVIDEAIRNEEKA